VEDVAVVDVEDMEESREQHKSLKVGAYDPNGRTFFPYILSSSAACHFIKVKRSDLQANRYYVIVIAGGYFGRIFIYVREPPTSR
jgi:hypothetical protein